MAIEGVDYSSARPGGAKLAAAGKRFVVRYVPYGGYKKGLTQAEVKDLHAHGISIALVYESTKLRPLAGLAAGKADATVSTKAATALGFPADTPIYFAVDWDASPGQQDEIDAYLKGAASVIGLARVGVYGGLRVCTRVRASGTAKWFWQTYAWSGGKIAPFIHLYQYRNGQNIHGAVDFCRAYRANFGQWPGDATATIHPPVPGSARYRVVITGITKLYSAPGGTVIGAVSAATYPCVRVKHEGVWWYQMAAGKRIGQAFRPSSRMNVKAI